MKPPETEREARAREAVRRVMRHAPEGDLRSRHAASMRFVSIKSVEQQSVLMLHRARDLLIRQRTQLTNALRAHLAELGLVAAKGREGLHQLVAVVTEC